MFNVPTPMASPSYEVMYDSLPPHGAIYRFRFVFGRCHGKSRVLESPLKEPVDSKPPVSKSPNPPVKKNEEQLKEEGQNEELQNKERRNEERRKEERRNGARRNEERRNEARRNEERRNEERRNKKRRNDERWNNEETQNEEQLKEEEQNEELQNEERRNVKIWNEEQRPRYPRFYRRPNFRPPYQRQNFKPRVYQRPPYAQQLMPTSQENAQVFFHSQGLAVLCIRNSGFTLTNGVVSYAMDRECPHELFKFLHHLHVGTICVTDQHSKQTFKDIQASWISSSPFKRTPVMLLNSNGRELGQCPFCNQATCHRWIAVQSMCAILHQPINPIFIS
ncbi:hypothetical protein TNCV_1995441 [Trichonephila clavipes]|nr:hypothetical protein TNCV_1995441 [Trichonephila clavipes]